MTPRLTRCCAALAALAAASCGVDTTPLAYDPLPEPYAPDVLAEGERVYRTRSCISCHGSNGDGTGRAPPLRGVNARLTAADQLWVVARGRGQMQGFENALTQDEIQAVVAYTRDAFG